MKHDFGIGIEVENNTGELLAVYFQIRKGKAAQTKEFADGNVFVDYAKNGELLGIEMLGPSHISVLETITANEPETQRFVNRSVPREMAIT